MSDVKTFKLTHHIFGTTEIFCEDTAPDWLTSVNTIKGSTMDYRWFWTDHVLKLNVGESVDADFHNITRIK